jgi:hypothetical protein
MASTPSGWGNRQSALSEEDLRFLDRRSGNIPELKKEEAVSRSDEVRMRYENQLGDPSNPDNVPLGWGSRPNVDQPITSKPTDAEADDAFDAKRSEDIRKFYEQQLPETANSDVSNAVVPSGWGSRHNAPPELRPQYDLGKDVESDIDTLTFSWAIQKLHKEAAELSNNLTVINSKMFLLERERSDVESELRKKANLLSKMQTRLKEIQTGAIRLNSDSFVELSTQLMTDKADGWISHLATDSAIVSTSD